VDEFAPRILCSSISARAVKVRPAGRVGSTIRGGQLPSSVSAGHLSRSLRRRCRRRESPHAHSLRDAHSLPTSKTMDFSTTATPLRIFSAAEVEPF
jgi:hypothetical protein